MNYRQVLAALLCALLVVSAGCATFTSDEAESTTPSTAEPATPTAAPTATTESTDAGTTESAERLAPGLTSDGVTDALALANAHRDALTNGPFVRHSSVEESNGSTSAFQRSTLYYANESHWRQNVTADGLPLALGATDGTFDQYADGERVLFRLQADGNVSYGVAFGMTGDSTPPSEALPESTYARDLVYTLFANADVTVESEDGPTSRVTGTAAALTVDGQRMTNVEFEASVYEGGLVRSLDLSYERGETSVDRSLSFEETDESPVERPDWYDTALNQTNGG